MRPFTLYVINHTARTISRTRSGHDKLIGALAWNPFYIALAILQSEGRKLKRPQLDAFINVIRDRKVTNGIARIDSHEISAWCAAKRERDMGEVATARLLSI